LLRGALSGLNDQIWKVYAAVSDKSAILPLAHAQLTLAADDLMRADLLQLVGEIYFDGNRYADAARCYTEAAVAASGETADYDLWACALTRHAFIGVYERRFADALRLLELAEGVAARGDSQLTTSPWVQVVKAQALAGLGNTSECRRSLDLSRAVDGRTHNGGWLRFDGSRIAEEAGACFIQLGRVDQAEAELELALTGLPAPSRRRGVVLADLAMVGVLRKDREYALHYAGGALEIARETGSGLLTRKLMNVQAEMLGAW
jgi:tetratricopeptide (TPR) repeat protein